MAAALAGGIIVVLLELLGVVAKTGGAEGWRVEERKASDAA